MKMPLAASPPSSASAMAPALADGEDGASTGDAAEPVPPELVDLDVPDASLPAVATARHNARTAKVQAPGNPVASGARIGSGTPVGVELSGGFGRMARDSACLVAAVPRTASRAAMAPPPASLGRQLMVPRGPPPPFPPPPPRFRRDGEDDGTVPGPLSVDPSDIPNDATSISRSAMHLPQAKMQRRLSPAPAAAQASACQAAGSRISVALSSPSSSTPSPAPALLPVLRIRAPLAFRMPSARQRVSVAARARPRASRARPSTTVALLCDCCCLAATMACSRRRAGPREGHRCDARSMCSLATAAGMRRLPADSGPALEVPWVIVFLCSPVDSPAEDSEPTPITSRSGG